MNKKKVAILASFPAWLINSDIPAPNQHYAVWLVSLYQLLPSLCHEYEFHWITFCKGIKKAIHCVANNQTFHIFPAYSLRLGQMTHYIRERFCIHKVLKKINPDIVHAWGTETFYALAAKSFKGKKILSMQGVLTAYAKRASMAPFQIRQSKLEPATLQAYTIVTAESSWAVERCKELAPNTTVIQWEYSANKDFFKINRTISDQPYCVLAGTDTPVKDVESAIIAFSSPQLSHVRLLLAGIDAQKRPNLPPNIIALGRVDRKRIADLLQSAWCVVHPSLADCCPNIIKEARVIGLPCIVTEECGAKQYVENGLSGFVIPTKSPQKIIEAVLHITQDKNTSLKMGKHNHELCRTALSEETMLQGIQQLYASLIK